LPEPAEARTATERPGSAARRWISAAAAMGLVMGTRCWMATTATTAAPTLAGSTPGCNGAITEGDPLA